MKYELVPTNENTVLVHERFHDHDVDNICGE